VTAEVRIIGDAIMPERVIIELAGAIQWSASNGALVGVMLRRPGVSMKATSALVLKSGRLACHRIIIDNAGGGGAAITIHHGGYMHLQRTIITNAVGSGVFIHPGASASLSRCSFSNNKQSGLSIAPGAFCFIQNCAFDCNAVAHVTALACSRLALKCNQLGALADDTRENAVKKDNGAFVAST